MYPDAAKLSVLESQYLGTPVQLANLDVLKVSLLMTEGEIKQQMDLRKQQITQIDGFHKAITDYMQALGKLADDKQVNINNDKTAITTGLTDLSKVQTGLGITANEITAVGDIFQFVADAATQAYRQDKLEEIIGKAEKPFQEIILAERRIVNDAFLPELQNVRGRVVHLAQISHALQVNAQDDECKAKQQAAKLAEHKPGKHFAESSEVSLLDPKLQHGGAADLASKYLLQQNITARLATLDDQIQAAQAYVKLMDQISKAHTELYNQRKDVLSEDGAKRIKAAIEPLTKEAKTAWKDIQKL
jgi:hypothetical protein